MEASAKPPRIRSEAPMLPRDAFFAAGGFVEGATDPTLEKLRAVAE